MSPAKRTGGERDRLEPYRKVRKPVPPPARVLPDRRRLREEAAEREAREAGEEGRGR